MFRAPSTSEIAYATSSPYAFWGIVRSVAFLTFMLLILGGVTGVCRGQPSGYISREYDIKAVYLYHFSSYIEWPASDFRTENAPFVIGVFKSDPFGSALERVAQKKKVRGRPIELRLVHSVGEALECQILFIPKSVPLTEQNAVLRAAMDHPVLTVGESSDFIQRGGNAEFYLEGNKVRIAFGAEAARRGDLKVSPKLLTIAKIVTDN